MRSHLEEADDFGTPPTVTEVGFNGPRVKRRVLYPIHPRLLRLRFERLYNRKGFLKMACIYLFMYVCIYVPVAEVECLSHRAYYFIRPLLTLEQVALEGCICSRFIATLPINTIIASYTGCEFAMLCLNSEEQSR